MATKRKDPKTLKKRGRKSKKDSIHYEGLKLCYSKGFTDKETALALQITDDTLNNWKRKDPKFFKSLIDWKLEADAKVERALYERAVGFECPDTKAQWVQDDNGGRWEYAELKKIYPPDTPAMTMWLKNRKPKVWREKQEIEHSGTVNISITGEDSECL